MVLGIVYRVLSTHLIRKAGFTHKTARTGAVTLIQRFGGALNLNVHLHRLFLDGVYGVFAPNSQHRARVTKAGRSKGRKTTHATQDPTPAERHIAMTWAQRLRRVFGMPQGTLS